MNKAPLMHFLVLVSFLLNIFGVMPNVQAEEFLLPKPGVMVHLSPEFTPAYLKGIVIHPENALKFDFIIYKGDKELTESQKKEEYTKLTKYFLASLAIPDDDQWVNLSPYEKDRIIKDNFGKTEMGRDLLAQDYMLKQITASLIYPEDNLGKKFWDKIYSEAQKQFGTTNIPVNTFNKVWILPDDALIYEKGNTAYVIKNHLKVMLEQDYLALQKHSGIQSVPKDDEAHTVASKIVKEIVLPELEREVNEGQNFAALRQVYSGMLLATWYKRAIRESLLSKVYANKGKVKGVDQDPKTNEEIYQQYLKAYKKGVFNFIKEEVNKYTNEAIPRKYFSGGVVGSYKKAAEELGHETFIRAKTISFEDNAMLISGIQSEKYDYAEVIAREGQEVVLQANHRADRAELAEQPTLEELESKLFAVHATKFLPKNGVAIASASDLSGDFEGEEPPSFRATIHFALGELVRSDTRAGDWNDHPYAIVAPIKSLKKQLVNIFPTDTYILGDLHLSSETIIVVPKGTDISNIPSQVPVVEYEPKVGLRTAVEQVIDNKKGWRIRIPDNFELSAIATLDGKEITSGFFSALFTQYPELSYGTSKQSERGDAFRIGYLDMTLNQLMKYYDPSVSIGSGQKEIPFYRAEILHHLSKLEESLNRRVLSEEAKVAFADKKARLLAWLNIVNIDLELKKRYGKTLGRMSQKIWKNVLQKRNNPQELKKYVDSIINELPYEERDGRPLYMGLITAHLRMMSPAEIKEFREKNGNVLSGINIEKLTSGYAIERWLIVGTDEAKREGLDKIISENGSLDLEQIFESLETDLSNASNRLADALEILRQPRINAFLRTQGVIFAQNGPQSLEDVLKAHPKTMVLFENSELNLTPEEQEARELLEKIGQAERSEPLQEALQSFKSAKWKAMSDGWSKDRLKNNLIEVKKPMITMRSLEDYRMGDTLELYSLLYRDDKNPTKLWAKAGLAKEFQEMFPNPNTFWQSRLSLLEVYQRLKKMASGDKAQVSSVVVPNHTDFKKGGIDLNSVNLNLQIKRDGMGVPLPISQQDLENIKIDGLIPVIIDIKPAMATHLLTELKSSPI